MLICFQWLNCVLMDVELWILARCLGQEPQTSDFSDYLDADMWKSRFWSIFLVGVMTQSRTWLPSHVVGNVSGVLCSIRGLLVVWTSTGGIAFAWPASLLSGIKCDLEYSCRQLISEQEVSWIRRLGEFNKCFFTGKQSKLLFKLLPVIAFLVLNNL